MKNGNGQNVAAREETVRDYQERLNRVLVHIQQHLDDALSLDDLARVACFSPFHFHRIFAAYVQEPVSSYVRRLRLERAAWRLCHTEDPVTDVALDAGYETPGAFTKAFTQVLGENPTSFRKRKTAGLLPQKKLVITLRSEEKIMKPKIREMKDMRVAYVRRTGNYNTAAGEAWKAICAYAGPKRLFGRNTICLGIGHDDPAITPEDKLRYDACLSVGPDVQPEGEVGVQTIPAGKHAVFLHKGPYDQLGKTYAEIYGQWLPSSGSKLREAPCFEVYLDDPDRTPPAKLRTEICVPIE